MSSVSTPADGDAGRIARYVVNGLVATAVHFGILTFELEVLRVPSAGAANVVAAAFGITASFLGNRYWVFRKREHPFAGQAARFVALYAAIACVHGLVLFAWTDLAHLDYRIGFLIAPAIQVVLGYWGNKRLVFHR
jgi:putative flippase GtrA